MVDQRRATMRGGAQQHGVQAGALLDQGAMEPEPVSTRATAACKRSPRACALRLQRLRARAPATGRRRPGGARQPRVAANRRNVSSADRLPAARPAPAPAARGPRLPSRQSPHRGCHRPDAVPRSRRAPPAGPARVTAVATGQHQPLLFGDHRHHAADPCRWRGNAPPRA